MKKLLIVLFLVSCASRSTPKLDAPSWTEVPPTVLDSLCARLQMDAIATGAPLALVSTTRPLATPPSLNALAITARGRTKTNRVAQSAMELNRAMPIASAGSSCRWRAIAAAEAERLHDEMLVELSAPSVHPFDPKSGGLFARVTVGGQGASWYWVTLIPNKGRWAVGPVYVLVQ